jgi:hypothetical protein
MARLAARGTIRFAAGSAGAALVVHHRRAHGRHVGQHDRPGKGDTVTGERDVLHARLRGGAARNEEHGQQSSCDDRLQFAPVTVWLQCAKSDASS